MSAPSLDVPLRESDARVSVVGAALVDVVVVALVLVFELTPALCDSDGAGTELEARV